MQAVADLTQTEVEVYPSAHATPLGAVALARKSVNAELSLADAVVKWEPATTYTPLWSSERALEHRDRWTRAVEASLHVEGNK